MRSIAVALVVKGVLTIVTFGIKVPAGIFIPTLGGMFDVSMSFPDLILLVGACFGRIIGIAVHRLYLYHPSSALFASCESGQECVVPGLYAMVSRHLLP
jgi:chloride channel 3/4/5